MILGISGKKQSGKDTTALVWQYIMFKKVDKGNWSFIDFKDNFIDGNSLVSTDEISGWDIKMFAYKLKRMVCLMLDCTMVQLEDNDFKERPLGEEWARWVIYYNEHNTIFGVYKTKEEAEEGVIAHYGDMERFKTFEHARIVKQILTPRIILQELGTQVGRVIHPSTWVNATLSSYKPIGVKQLVSDKYIEELGNRKDDFCPITDRPIYPNWIIKDVRFPNEVEGIEKRGGIVIRVNRDINLRQPKLWNLFVASTDYMDTSVNGTAFYNWLAAYDFEAYKSLKHESETALDNYPFKYHITNNDTVDSLIASVKNIIQSIGIK